LNHGDQLQLPLIAQNHLLGLGVTDAKLPVLMNAVLTALLLTANSHGQETTQRNGTLTTLTADAILRPILTLSSNIEDILELRIISNT